MSEKLQYILIGLFFLVTGVAVFITASQTLAIIWGVGILITGLGVTGVLGSIYAKLTGKP